MIISLRIISFHIALLITSFWITRLISAPIELIFLLLPKVELDHGIFLKLVNALNVVIVFYIILKYRTLNPKVWVIPELDAGLKLIKTGHLGLGFCIAAIFVMMLIGGGSGVILAPAFIWAIYFYFKGILKITSFLLKSEQKA